VVDAENVGEQQEWLSGGYSMGGNKA